MHSLFCPWRFVSDWRREVDLSEELDGIEPGDFGRKTDSFHTSSIWAVMLELGGFVAIEPHRRVSEQHQKAKSDGWRALDVIRPQFSRWVLSTTGGLTIGG